MATRRSGRMHRLLVRVLSRVDRRRLVDYAVAIILLAAFIFLIIILLWPQFQPTFKNISNDM
jgi:hypothetical protein